MKFCRNITLSRLNISCNYQRQLRSVKNLYNIDTRLYSFITTPIFYVNSSPHLGHLYSLLLADAGNRFNQILSNKVSTTEEDPIFLTGTDEHGLKVQQAAQLSKLTPIQHCDKVSNAFRKLCSDFSISNTDFVRTTEKRHLAAVSHFWNVLSDRGHIYKGKYEGWYSISDEAFLQKNEEVIDKFDHNRAPIKVSSETGKAVEWFSEENYMFDLRPFRNSIRDWILKNNAIQPEIFSRPVLRWLEEEELMTLSVSRPSQRLTWGIPVPNDSSQVIYVWLDALVNYLTGVGYPKKGFVWPPTTQIVGKDIIKFHGFYWPAFLLAAGLQLPKKILCHSHWTVDDVKMSKSLGNVVNPFDLKEKFSLDAIRYFLLREGVPHSDGNFNEDKLVRVVNAELADTLGNLLSRCAAPALNPLQIWPAFSQLSFSKLASPLAAALRKSLEELPEKVISNYSNYNFYRGLEYIMATLRLANGFVEEEKPWLLVKVSPREESLLTMTSLVMETLRTCGTLLLPVIPALSTHLLDRLNVDPDRRNCSHLRPFIWEADSQKEHRLQEKTSILFKRIQRKSSSTTANSQLMKNCARQFHTTTFRPHGDYEWKDPEKEEDIVMIKVYDRDGKAFKVRGKVGDNLLYLCKRFDVDMEGACEASLACTTCHVYVEDGFLDLLPEATEVEEDLLDQAPFLKENSRLGCQIILSKELDGIVLRLPAATKNFYVDGHKPSHH